MCYFIYLSNYPFGMILLKYIKRIQFPRNFWENFIIEYLGDTGFYNVVVVIDSSSNKFSNIYHILSSMIIEIEWCNVTYRINTKVITNI